MKTSKVLLNIVSVFCFIYFALYIFTLVFIPIGVYCFLAGKRFSFKAENLDENVIVPKNVFKAYVIFASIFVFPFGLLSIIPYLMLSSNRIKINDLKYTYVREEPNVAIESERQPEEPAETTSEEAESKANTADAATEVEAEVGAESDEEKLEKFKKLENFKEKGLITEEELEQAREQLFGNKKK